MKICIKCSISKDYDNFFMKKSSKDGLQSMCKFCIKLEHKIWRNKNREEINKKSKNWYKENSEIHKIRVENWRKRNYDKIQEDIKKWDKLNVDKKRSYYAKRRALKKQALPKWLSLEQIKLIEEIYFKAEELSKQTGIRMEVDHIVPLQGKNVCGLHVPWNLQILTGLENRKKGNRVYEV